MIPMKKKLLNFIQFFNSRLVILFSIVAFILLATIAYLDFRLKLHPNLSTQRQSWGKTLQYANPDESTAQKVTINSYIPAYPENNTVTISFYYRCTPQCPQIWLEPETLGLNRLLVFHPWFSNNPMPHLSEFGLSLYQPPNPNLVKPSQINLKLNSPVAVEDWYLNSLPHFPQAIPLSSASAQPAYILTAFEKPRIFGNWLEFHRVITLPGKSIVNRFRIITIGEGEVEVIQKLKK